MQAELTINARSNHAALMVPLQWLVTSLLRQSKVIKGIQSMAASQGLSGRTRCMAHSARLGTLNPRLCQHPSPRPLSSEPCHDIPSKYLQTSTRACSLSLSPSLFVLSFCIYLHIYKRSVRAAVPRCATRSNCFDSFFREGFFNQFLQPGVFQNSQVKTVLQLFCIRVPHGFGDLTCIVPDCCTQ